MFVDTLSQQEKTALLQLLTFMARADGKIAKQEWGFLNQFSESYGLIYDINAELDFEHICASLETCKSRVIALQQVIKMAFSDGQYEQSERANAAEIAQKFGFSQAEFERIESWVIQGVQWVKDGEAMIAEVC